LSIIGKGDCMAGIKKDLYICYSEGTWFLSLGCEPENPEFSKKYTLSSHYRHAQDKASELIGNFNLQGKLPQDVDLPEKFPKPPDF